MRALRHLVASLAIVCSGACGEPAPSDPARHSLVPGPNPFGPDHPLWAPQPHRDRPLAVALSHDGKKLYVTLQGTDDDPGHEVAVVDTVRERAIGRIAVGASPTGLALHPGGRFLVVTNRYSSFASVIDTFTDQVVLDVSVPFYCVDVAFTPDGRRSFLANRWKDSVLSWELQVGASFRVVGDDYSDLEPDAPMGIAVGDNPRDLALSPDGRRLFVASPTALTLSIIDVEKRREQRRVLLGSPPGDVVVTADRVFVSHTGRGTHHPPDQGFDTDGDGAPGDGTANVMFQDLQNEIAVLDHAGDVIHEYTSDSICCGDYRDVDPDHPERGASLPAPDSWPASRIASLPPRDTWIVACALPEQMGLSASGLHVVCSGSNEVQSFDLGPGGTLTPRQSAGELYATGMQPQGIVVTADGRRAFVAERLGEHLTVLDLEAGPGNERRILVGDVSGGEFPATDAEIGEALNFVTAPLTVDGDQTCAHCHRDGGNLAKPVAMPLQQDAVWGTRMQMAYRGAFDTRPWFFESAMDETNFFPVINEFARKENFCCEGLDPLVWSGYPTVAECLSDPGLSGCEHVLDCENQPPPECALRNYGSPHGVRNAHFRAGAQHLLGRDRTFGDALYSEWVDADGRIVREGIPLDFDGVTRALGLFLMQSPRLLPNPNAALALPAARRGRELYESPSTGCASCHPLPVTTVSTTFDPAGVPLRFSPVVTPRRNPETGADADRVVAGFVATFPMTEQDDVAIRFGVPQLRGIWDRAPRFFHDGRAPSLKQALASPNHPALAPGEVGFNETDGMPDTHGATSHLTPAELDELIAFLSSL